MLKDSKILAVVEKWAAQICAGAAAVSAKNETSESSDSSAPTPAGSEKDVEGTTKDNTTVVSSSSMEVTPSAMLPSLPGAVTFEGIPHKKRFQLLRLQSEEASSSDSEVCEFNKIPEKIPEGVIVGKTGEGSVEEGNAESASEQEVVGNEAIAAICVTAGADTMSESSQDASELGQGDASKVSNSCVTELASELLTGWVDLKVGSILFHARGPFHQEHLNLILHFKINVDP